MKSKLFLLSLVALTLAFTACNKNQDEPQSTTDATISVAVKSADLRAYEDGAGNEDKKVQKLAVMVYQGDAQVAYKEADNASALEVTKIQTTAGAKTLVVVANYANQNLKGLSLAKVKALTHTLSADDQDPTKGTFMLTAEPVSVNLQKGNNYYGYADGDGNRLSIDKPIELQHIHAGMALTSVTVAFAESYAALYSVKFDKGALMALIAKAQSNVFGEPLANADLNYLYGEEHFGTQPNAYTPAAANYNEMAELKMDITEVGATMTGKGFYVLENNSGEHPTILCLKATLTQANGSDLTADQAQQAVEAGWIVSTTDHSTYYPVLVNWAKDGYTYADGHTAKNAIVRNNKYEISLTITGPGTNSPEDPTQEKANLDVKCVVTPWVIVKQNVVW